MLANHGVVSSAAREQVSWQIAVGARLGETLMQGLRQYAELNMGMVRVTLEQGNIVIRQLAAAQDARQFLSLASAQIHPGILRGLDYGYYSGKIFSGMQGGMLQVLSVMPDSAPEWPRPAHPGDPAGWNASFSLLKAIAESALRFPVDVARAARLALNLNAPAWESGKLRIAYAGPGR